MNNKESQEENEGVLADIFLELYNSEHGTDYQTGPAKNEKQDSIVDRRGVSKSSKYQDLKMQFKEVKERDEELTKDIREDSCNNTQLNAYNNDIFIYMNKQIKKAYETRKNDPEVIDTILVLVSYVAKDWLTDWIKEYKEEIEKSPFREIYCLNKKSVLSEAFIFPLKILIKNGKDQKLVAN